MADMRTWHKELIKTQMDLSKRTIVRTLRNPEELTPNQLRGIVGTYRLAVEPNFIPWIILAHKTSSSPRAKELIAQNIKDEIEENHPLMLRKFAKDCGVHIRQEDYDRALPAAARIWKLFVEDNRVTNLAIAATLENMSTVFIPYLAHIGKMLGCTDFTYTDKHGVADIKHAVELEEGLAEQMLLEKEIIHATSSLAIATNETVNFLEAILTTDPVYAVRQ